MHPENATQDPPVRIGPYRLEQPLGSGGMGEVWRAWDERLERHVALKQIRPNATLRHGRERLRREARAAARLNHPSIVHIYDFLESVDGDWIVMELVEGRTLRALLDEESTLPLPRALQICREITEGLAEAHRRGILHRDLKANNVIIATSGRAKILDFGLAKEIPRAIALAGWDLTASTPGVILGTCFAMSPEQVLGRPLDERSDLFSLGSLFYEVLTGEAPFRAENAALSMARVVYGELPPLQESYAKLPPAVGELMDWLLRKEPQHRPQSADEVLAALDSAVDTLRRTEVPAGRRPPHGESGASSSVTFAEPVHPGELPGEDREPRRHGGERRTVTLACCALVQVERSRSEAGALDLEILSQAVIAFEALAREISREFSGFLGATLNRILWLCFGYPQAHEHDAERAVRAVRELQERFAALSIAAAHRLAVRAGLHTGLAVVVPRPSAGPALQVGDTFDIAMAIQGQVPAGRIGVSAASQRLLGRQFASHPLPAFHLRDLDLTVEVYELGSFGPPLRGAGPEGWEESPLSPLVNREAELQILLDRFRLARAGSGQAVLIAGEAGIGKSRLVRALAERLAAEQPAWLAAHGSAFAQNMPLAPIVELLSRAIFAAKDGTGSAAEEEEKLQRLEETLDSHDLPRVDHAPFLGALLSVATEQRYPPPILSPEAWRKRTRAALLALLCAMAEHHPLVLVIEDLHWIDPSTLDLLDLLLGRIPALPLLLVTTFRPEFSPTWRHQTSVTQLNLGGLSEAHVTQLIEQVTEGQRLPARVCREIVTRTDGIPLFVEELTKMALEGGTALHTLQKPAGIPLTLGGFLLARLDRLGEAKAVAQLAAVIGRSFTLEQLEALSWIKGTALRAALDQLLQAEILHRRGPASRARYLFKHALIQDAAYLSLLASDRRQLHQRLVRLLQETLPAVAEAEPEMMAHHCERGGLPGEAIDHLQRAGQRAIQRSAPREAVSHLGRALDLLLSLPAAPESLGRELALRSTLSPVLGAIKGWADPEVARNAERCTALCREMGDHARLIPALYGLWAYHLLRGDGRAIELADEIARLAATPAQVYMGCATRAYTAYHGGRFAMALALSQQAMALHDPGMIPELETYGFDSSLMPYVYQVWALWYLGEPEQSLHKRDQMNAVVETLRSPFLFSTALFCEMTLLHDLRVPDPERVEALAEQLIQLAGEQEFAFLYAGAYCAKGWAVCQRGDLGGGAAIIQNGLDLYKATGARLALGYWSCYLIEAHLASGQLDAGLAAAREALSWSETQFDVKDDAGLLRLEGELLRAAGDAGAAEAAFQKALTVARGQGSRALALRAATSLTRLLAEQGRASEALPALSAIYHAYTEGFATRDLQEARELLDRHGAP